MIKKSEVNELEREYNTKADNFIQAYIIVIKNKIKDLFLQGSKITLKMLNREDLKDIEPTQREVELFQDLVFENIKGVTEDMRREISNQLNIGLSQSETKKQLRDRLDAIFKGDNPTKLKYKKRLDLILRTESARIFNSGSFKTAKRLGVKYKYLVGANDSRQGEDSKIALRKYGTPEQAISIDKDFEFTYGSTRYKYKLPPNRPNDRETCLFLFDKPSKK